MAPTNNQADKISFYHFTPYAYRGNWAQHLIAWFVPASHSPQNIMLGGHACMHALQKVNCYFNASSSLPRLQTCFRLLSSPIVWYKQGNSCYPWMFLKYMSSAPFVTYTQCLDLVIMSRWHSIHHPPSSLFNRWRWWSHLGMNTTNVECMCQNEVGNKNSHGNCHVYTSDSNSLKHVCNQDDKVVC